MSRENGDSYDLDDVLVKTSIVTTSINIKSSKKDSDVSDMKNHGIEEEIKKKWTQDEASKENPVETLSEVFLRSHSDCA